MSRAFRAGWGWLLLTALLPSAKASDPDVPNYTQNGSSSHWTPEEWTSTTQYEKIRNYAARPDEETLNSLSVEWQEPELDALGNQLNIRGQLFVTDSAKDQQPSKPINWFQGITIYLGMSPGAEPEWSQGMDQADTLHTGALTSPTGSFETRIDMRKSKYDRGQAQSFQFGVALAKHSGTKKRNQKVVWNSRVPAIPSSVQMLAVPAAPTLSRELALINRASGWPFANPRVRANRRLVAIVQFLQRDRGAKGQRES